MVDAATVKFLEEQNEYETSRTAPPADFPAMPDIPAARYTSQEFFELENTQIWARNWVYAGHVDELESPGSFIQMERTKQPIVIVRGKDDEFRAFYNICTHHGMKILLEEKGQVPRMTCGYHGWTFGLDGKLIGVPDERDFVDLDKSCRGLRHVRLERWGNWLFINEDPDAEPLRDSIGPMFDEMSEYKPETFRLANKHSFRLDCNWKMALENFLEAYHLPVIHQNTVNKTYNYKGASNTLFPGGQSRMAMPSPLRGHSEMGEALADMPRIETADEFISNNIMTYIMFPNIFSTWTAYSVCFMMLWPIDIDTTHFDVVWFGPDWGDRPQPKGWDAVVAHLDEVLEEDRGLLETYKQVSRSRVYESYSFPLNYQERKIYHLHEEIDKRIGIERIHPKMRVAQVLDPVVHRPAG